MQATTMDTSDSQTTQKPPVPVALFKKRGAKSKVNLRKRPATPPPATSDSDDFSSDDDAGKRVKRRYRATVAVAAASKSTSSNRDTGLTATVFTADRDAPITSTNDATRQSNWYEEDAKDSISAKKLLGSSRPPTQAAQPDGTYRGLANQATFIQKNPNAPQRTVGPIKAPTNIRTITVTDFAPDVCKDYKQTGFCGFGDNCKFLHSREDYKHGWQLDKEWENVTKGTKNLAGTVVASANRDKHKGDEDEDEEMLLESIPFVCIICRQSYKEPVVTKCRHYFCEPCALKRYRRDPTCTACGAATNGVFNSAKRLQKLLTKKRERVAKKRQEALEAGDEVSEDEADGEDG